MQIKCIRVANSSVFLDEHPDAADQMKLFPKLLQVQGRQVLTWIRHFEKRITTDHVYLTQLRLHIFTHSHIACSDAN